MTDREQDSKGFLQRWSRKKIDAERESLASSSESAATEAAPGAAASSQQLEDHGGETAPAASKPEFDLASLPSLDSITAATDIRGFLAPGVPRELARAALRRAWSSDPAIRDFKGLAENDWDFTAPNAMAGFGELPPGTDVKKLVAQIFGESEKPADADAVAKMATASPGRSIAEEPAPPSPAAEAALPPSDEAETATPTGIQVAQAEFVQRDNNIAAHNSGPTDETDEGKSRRHHGGALPQ